MLFPRVFSLLKPPHRAVVLALLPGALLLVACADDSPRRAPAAEPAPGVELAPAAQSEPAAAVSESAPRIGLVEGEAYYLERITMPLESTLLISVRDAAVQDAVLGELRREQAGNPPYEFRLTLDPDALYEAQQPVLDIRLIDAVDGVARFATQPPVALDPGAARGLQVRLSVVVAEDASKPVAGVHYQNYQCGDVPVEARFEQAHTVWLTLPDRDLRLSALQGGSGARFGSDLAEFVAVDGDTATVTLSGAAATECQVTDRRSPWADARDRGVRFRAAGNEPAWLLEVDMGPTPELRLDLDYGATRVAFEQAEWLSASEPMQVQASSDGHSLQARLLEESCMDSMSGQVFPVRVELVLDGDEVSGCGRFLF